MHVSLVGLGPSYLAYIELCERHGGRHAFCDETWAINTWGSILASDRIFHMDDVRVQEIRAQAGNSYIGHMLNELQLAEGPPIYTSREHPEYPRLRAFPLEDVINACGTDYFNCTPAYAIAYAIYLGVRRISLFGIDFTYPNAHHAEKGRGCCEYWLGRAMQRGIEVFVPKPSSLLDACYPQSERLYGYDTLDVSTTFKDGKCVVGMTPRETLPSAAEIEKRYNHKGTD
jgi:hypothetical protein